MNARFKVNEYLMNNNNFNFPALDKTEALIVIIFLFLLNAFDWITSAFGVVNILRINPTANIWSFIITAASVIIILTFIYGWDFFLGRNQKNVTMILIYLKNIFTALFNKIFKKSQEIEWLPWTSNLIVTGWLFARLIDWYTSFVGLYTWLVKGTSPTNIDFVDFGVFISDNGFITMIILMLAAFLLCLSPLALICFLNSSSYTNLRKGIE